MKTIKYLLLIMLCFYGEQIYSQKKRSGCQTLLRLKFL